jgi:c-di-GMP-binding flagellar brake protein YcgR
MGINLPVENPASLGEQEDKESHMDNRRQERRLKEEHKVTFVIISEDKNPIDDKTYYALTEDISTSGMKIMTEQLLQIGTLLRIELSLGGENKIIKLFGKVRWVEDLYDGELFTTGIAFTDNPPRKIMNLIEHVFKKD